MTTLRTMNRRARRRRDRFTFRVGPSWAARSPEEIFADINDLFRALAGHAAP